MKHIYLTRNSLKVVQAFLANAKLNVICIEAMPQQTRVFGTNGLAFGVFQMETENSGIFTLPYRFSLPPDFFAQLKPNANPDHELLVIQAFSDGKHTLIDWGIKIPFVPVLSDLQRVLVEAAKHPERRLDKP